MTLTSIIIGTILSIYIILTLFIFYRTIKKVERYEDAIKAYEHIIVSQNKTMSNISKIIVQSGSKLKELDQAQAFESDDETGVFFKQLINVQKQLDQYVVNYDKVYGEKEI